MTRLVLLLLAVTVAACGTPTASGVPSPSVSTSPSPSPSPSPSATPAPFGPETPFASAPGELPILDLLGVSGGPFGFPSIPLLPAGDRLYFLASSAAVESGATGAPLESFVLVSYHPATGRFAVVATPVRPVELRLLDDGALGFVDEEANPEARRYRYLPGTSIERLPAVDPIGPTDAFDEAGLRGVIDALPEWTSAPAPDCPTVQPDCTRNTRELIPAGGLVDADHEIRLFTSRTGCPAIDPFCIPGYFEELRAIADGTRVEIRLDGRPLTLRGFEGVALGGKIYALVSVADPTIGAPAPDAESAEGSGEVFGRTTANGVIFVVIDPANPSVAVPLTRASVE
jgi:hypothetical protein